MTIQPPQRAAPPVRFANRTQAGRALAAQLMDYRDRGDVVVLGLPRGGVIVARELAAVLRAPLDVLPVRKLGVPGHSELAMGAIGPGGVRVVSDDLIQDLQIPAPLVERVAEREAAELQRRTQLYRGARSAVPLRDRTIILVDDGLATGSTMHAAVLAARSEQPASIVIGVPVGSREACDDLGRLVDRLVCIQTPEPFTAVGLWYEDFSETTDDDVRAALSSTV
jgi:putative phosphoribosyl transferase